MLCAQGAVVQHVLRGTAEDREGERSPRLSLVDKLKDCLLLHTTFRAAGLWVGKSLCDGDAGEPGFITNSPQGKKKESIPYEMRNVSEWDLKRRSQIDASSESSDDRFHSVVNKRSQSNRGGSQEASIDSQQRCSPRSGTTWPGYPFPRSRIS